MRRVAKVKVAERMAAARLPRVGKETSSGPQSNEHENEAEQLFRAAFAFRKTTTEQEVVENRNF